jgi:hypothetical protein
MKCIDCEEEIPEERLEILNAKGWPIRCVKCSKVQPLAAFMDFEHKTGGQIVVVPNNPDGTQNKELVRIAERAFRRSR